MKTLDQLDERIAALHRRLDDAKAQAFSPRSTDDERAALQRQVADDRAALKRLLAQRRDAARGLWTPDAWDDAVDAYMRSVGGA